MITRLYARYRFAFLVALFLALRPAISAASWPPVQWQAFGPVMPYTHGQDARPDPHALIPREALLEVPGQLVIGDEVFPAVPVEFTEPRLNLAERFDGVVRGKMVLLSTAYHVPEAVTLRLGASADWFMQWWLNAEPVYSTLGTGNQSANFQIRDHTFDLHLQPGENILAVAVLSGSSDFLLVIGDPGEFDLALERFEQQQYAEAAELFSRVVRQPDLAQELLFEAYLYLGQSLTALGRPIEAAAAFRDILDIPDAPAHYRSRALLEVAAAYSAAGQQDDAAEIYRRVMIMPRIPLRHRSLARYELRRLTE